MNPQHPNPVGSEYKPRGRSAKKCQEPGCEREHTARGMCQLHYSRWERAQFASHPEKKAAVYTPGRKSWDSMKGRCYNPKEAGYDNYGGRGIKVCDRWLHGENGMTGFECFIADLGERPTKGHSLDRIDSDGDYTPENCCWATRREQVWNSRPVGSASGKRGITRDGKKWKARIFIGKQPIHLGVFDNLEDAIKARQEVELKYRIGSERRAGALEALQTLEGRCQFNPGCEGCRNNSAVLGGEIARLVRLLTKEEKEV